MNPLLKNLVRSILIGAAFGLPILAAQKGNDPAAPPAAFNQSILCDLPAGGRPVEVGAAFHLSEINKVDDEAETVEFSGVLTLVWRDSRQGFLAASEGVNEKFYHGAFQFNELSPGWYPQVILANASSVPEVQGVLLRVQPDGTCTLIQTINAAARARFNLRKYPFDRQRLEMIFEVLGFSSQEVVLRPTPNTFTNENSRIQVPQWDLLDLTTSARTLDASNTRIRGTSTAFVVTLDMERQSFFMVRLVLVPLILIVMLSWSVFWMDRSSLGDRMSVSFVGLLTAVAYQVVVGDIMPQISYMTLMNGYLNFSFLAMAATIVINLIVGFHDQNGDHIRGIRIDHVCRRAFPLAYLVVMGAVTAIAFIWF